MDDTLQG